MLYYFSKKESGEDWTYYLSADVILIYRVNLLIFFVYNPALLFFKKKSGEDLS